MMTFADVVSNSGDSVLESYTYADGRLQLVLVLGENDQKIALTLPTNDLAFAGAALANQAGFDRTCFLALEDLSQVLAVENGVYVPAPDFGMLMQQTRANYHLAYGRKAAEWTHLLSLVGYGRFVSCLVADVAAISIAEVAV
ncbi:hypothetical protein I2I05_21615 [Hymenobacter sp. BT683]|uniref:Uncharacterized protein n=1 Tax=Hymenobacter jeongseonensis TaxID=2791027 RepID=A0ABS0INQ2_9BACT|nr:hypothetical protein [Hymenobacter jeongseonensis]MBF9240003.1 hypothetical protein [Hymenobacter jeongseonensis]